VSILVVVTTDLMTRARAGDGDAFRELTEPHRRELQVHCYRMLGSFQDAEDVLQDTLLAAWQGLGGFEGRASMRTWLYRIATNRCLNALRSASRRPARAWDNPAVEPPEPTRLGEVVWLEPYPDTLFSGAGSAPPPGPEARYEQTEAMSLAFVIALQVLPPRQRAALIARDVLGWPASETASALGTSVAAANSALQRARATMQSHLPPRRAEWSAHEPSAQERALLEQFIDAHERLDAEAAIALAAQDLRITMPPHPASFDGAEVIRSLMADAAAMGDWRVLPVAANRMPAAAGYLRRPGDTLFRAFKLDVMRMQAGLIAEVTVFNAELFPAFGLPPTL